MLKIKRVLQLTRKEVIMEKLKGLCKTIMGIANISQTTEYPVLNALLKNDHKIEAFGRIDKQLESGKITAEQAQLEKDKWEKIHRG